MARLRMLPLVLVLSLIAVACGGGSDGSNDEAADAPAASDDAAVAEPTATPEPEPEPTATPEPEPEPDPTAEPAPAPEPTDAPEPTPEPTEAPEPAGFDAVDARIEEFIAEQGLAGASLVVVHRDEGIVHEYYGGDFDADRVSLIASSSKMVTAGVLFALADQGLLDLDAPIADQTGWELGQPAMTPAQLVSNSSGLVGLGPDLLYAPYLCQWLGGTDLSSCGESIATTTGDDDDVLVPDTEFRYGGGQWQVAGAIAEVVSGKSWAELIDEIYIEPCGVDSLGYLNLGSLPDAGLGGYSQAFIADGPDPYETANPNMEGGGYVNPVDYAELLLMHLRGGVCGDTQVLSEAAIDRMHSDRIAEAYEGTADGGQGYGYGWWIDRESGRISDGGAFGSYPWLDLDDGYGAFFVIEDGFQTSGLVTPELQELVHAAMVGDA